MSQYHTQISRYFRQSLIDADRLCPADKDILPFLGPDKLRNPAENYLALHHSVWQQGCIDPNLAEQILRARQPKNKPPLQQWEIVIFPRVDHLSYQGGALDKRKRTVLLPLVVFANLQRDGTLLPTNKIPWIPRIWIGPTQGATQPFTEMALLDEFLTLHPFEGINSWTQLTAYCTRMLCHATGTFYREHTEQEIAIELSELTITEDYDQSEECLLQLKSPIVGTTVNMLKVLDFLIEQNAYPRLYRSYSQRSDVKLRSFSSKQDDKAQAVQHLGQMSGEFPLSVKQRNALHYFIEQQKGEILAVNGPPGTGKTTLLRSVVANLWTQAALTKSEPPLIVATSHNNQAVTNILESFARIDERGLDETLTGRWLPDVDSYGLYFCSSTKANEKNPYRYSGPKGEGCMEVWQTEEFVSQAQEYFLAKVTRWQQRDCKNVDDALTSLHREMCAIEQKIHRGFICLEEWLLAQHTVKQHYGSVSALEDAIAHFKVSLEEQKKAYKQEKLRLDELYELWNSRSLLTTLLMWLPPIRKQENRKTSQLLNQWNIELSVNSDDAVEASMKQRREEFEGQVNQLQTQLLKAQQCLEYFLSKQEILNAWMSPAQGLKLIGKTLPEQVAEINDRYYRFRLFKLATHYFEARWLKETRIFVESHDSDKKSPMKLLRKLRRYAKLTPCFVSTFYMVPGTLLAGEYRDKVWTDLPQLEAIDLLIVDEAGQALPDVSAVSFALAKKALIVGDTDQIEPVWSIPAGVDRSNLILFELLKNEQDYENWLNSGLLVSSGNVMRMAQRQCHFHQFDKLQRGLYLTEHRRCFNDIIDYCNKLIYQGVLEPLRGNPKRDVPWGTMVLQPVSSPSRSYGGSRGNSGEARAIASWLMQEYHTILAYARQQEEKYQYIDDASVLCQTVGIVTPFSKQAELIGQELRKVGIKELTIGTVHSLQGDERLIVLFSSVYGENDKGSGKFYDAGPNMLNVAVSRAKDAFIVFGDPNVFGVTASGSPSGILRQRLELIKERSPAVESMSIF